MKRSNLYRRPMVEEFEPRLVPSTVLPDYTHPSVWNLASEAHPPTPKPYGPPPPAGGANLYWKPISGNSWSYAAGNGNTNWEKWDNTMMAWVNAKAVPGGSDNAYFDSAHSNTDCTEDEAGGSDVNRMYLQNGYTHTVTLAPTGATHTFIVDGGLTMTSAGTIDTNGNNNGANTLSIGDLQWTAGTFKSSGTSLGTVNVAGDTTVSNLTFTSSNGTIDGIKFQVTGTGHAAWLDEYGCGSGDNLSVKDSSYIAVYSGCTWQFAQSTNTSTSGGITSDGSSGQYFYVGLTGSFVGGTVERELNSRSSNDAPSGNEVVCALPMDVQNSGKLEVGDDLGFQVTGSQTVSIGTLGNKSVAIYVDSGSVQLTGGCQLTMPSKWYYQKGSSSLLSASDALYNNVGTFSGNTSVLSGAAVYIQDGTIKLPMYNAGSAGTGGINAGELSLSVTNAYITGSATIDLALWGNGTTGQSCDKIGVSLALVIGDAGTSTTENIVTYGTNNNFTWDIFDFGSTSFHNATANYSGAFGGLGQPTFNASDEVVH